MTARAREELCTLWELNRGGVVREMYLPGGPGAVLIPEADSKDVATEQLQRLPLLAERVMELELIELHPFGAIQMLFA